MGLVQTSSPTSSISVRPSSPQASTAAPRAALHLALHHRQHAVAGDEGAGKVGAAADGVDPDVLPVDLRQVVPNPAVALVWQRRAGAAHRLQARQIGLLHRLHAGLQAAGVEGRAGAEPGHAGGSGKAPQGAPVGRLGRSAGVAVEQADRGAAQQRAELRVPHDPAGAAEPVKAFAGLDRGRDIVVQAALEKLDNDAAVAMHDGFGQSGGAAAVDDPQRVVERQQFRVQRRIAGHPVGKGMRLTTWRGKLVGQRAGIDIGQKDQLLDRGQAGQHLAQHAAAVVHRAAPDLAVDRHQHLGRDLTKAVEHGHRAHVGAAHAPDGADAGGGEESHHRVRRVGQVGADAVAALHAGRAQTGGEGADLALQFWPANFHRRDHALVLKHQRRVAGGVGGVGVAKDLGREVELRAGEPARAGHHFGVDDRAVGRGRAQIEVVPDRGPESRQVGGRPAPEFVVAGEVQAALGFEPALVQRHAGRAGVHAAIIALQACPSTSTKRQMSRMNGCRQ